MRHSSSAARDGIGFLQQLHGRQGHRVAVGVEILRLLRHAHAVAVEFHGLITDCP